jgi:hypothetical protein
MVDDWVVDRQRCPSPRQMISSLGVQQHVNVQDVISTPTLPPSLVSWIEDFSWVKDSATWKELPDDNFVQFYKAYCAINPDRVQVPPEYMDRFKQRRAADCPEIWQIEEARACAPQSRDVVPPPPPDPPPPSAPPSGSPSEPESSTAEVRAVDGPCLPPPPHHS